MRSFADYNPIAVFVWFAAVTLVAMFCMNPAVAALSLLGSVTLYIVRNGARGWRSHAAFFALFAVIALINPLFYHNGATVLFVLNDNPVTLEALVYGVVSSATIVSVIYWFRSFSQIMTSERLLYLFGSVSPKTALLISMAMRYIPLLRHHTAKVNDAQRALGMYKDDNIIDDIRGGLRVFSIMVTWALENGIVTADSMSARGYGTGRRTFFSIYRFGRADALITALTLLFGAAAAAGIATGSVAFEYYPRITDAPAGAMKTITCISYGLLAFLPSIIEVGVKIKWKYLQSTL